MHGKSLILAGLLALTLLAACNSGNRKSEETPVATPSKIVPTVRLDSLIAVWPSLPAAERDSLLASDKDGLSLLLLSVGISDLTPEGVDRFAGLQWQETFGRPVAEAFADITSLRHDLGASLARLDSLMPSAGIKIAYTAVLPYRQSVIIADTAVYVVLNHYLGAEHPAYVGFPDYERRLKTAERIPIDAVEAAASVGAPYSADEPTALSRLLYEGALVQTVADVTGLPIAAVMGYYDEEFKAASAMEKAAWQRLVEGRMLFSKDPDIIQRLVGPSPSTPLLAPDAPGRMGRFIGWKIFRAWQNNHPEINATKFMADKTYALPTTLSDAGYEPE